MIELLVALVFVALAVVLLRGKGAFLIAGYNTMSEAERAQYDEKKLTQFMGKFMLVVALCCALLALHIAWITYVSIGVILGGTLFVVIYVNTGERFKSIG